MLEIRIESPETAARTDLCPEMPPSPVQPPFRFELKRRRKLALPMSERARIHRVLAKLSVHSNAVTYDGRRSPLRPVACAMLQQVLPTHGSPVSAESVFQKTNTRSLTLRALRQSAFRITRAFEVIDCPLSAHCWSGHILLRYRTWKFETPASHERVPSRQRVIGRTIQC